MTEKTTAEKLRGLVNVVHEWRQSGQLGITGAALKHWAETLDAIADDVDDLEKSRQGHIGDGAVLSQELAKLQARVERLEHMLRVARRDIAEEAPHGERDFTVGQIDAALAEGEA